MIIGIGNDIAEIERIKKACEKEAFLRRVYTEKERESSKNKAPYLAGCFSVKEAVSKAFGTGIRGFELYEIEVLRDNHGKPYVNLFGQAKDMAQKLGIDIFHVTITNTSQFAFSTVIAERR